MTNSLDRKVRVPDDVLVSELHGESVLLNLQTECYHGLDAVGTTFWVALTSTESIGQALEALRAQFDVDKETLRVDLLELVDALEGKGLVAVE